MNVDLHLHTYYSDGELSPLEIVKKSKENLANVIAITDHNTVTGVREAILGNTDTDITIIPGIEFDINYEDEGTFHLLGYNFSLDDEKLLRTCETISTESKEIISSLLVSLKKEFGIEFEKKDIDTLFSSKGNIGRPHIAKLCYDYGYVSSCNEAFSRLFKPLKQKGLVKKRKFKLESHQAIKLIKNAGGITCVAHPVLLKKSPFNLSILFKELQKYGLDAIETYHSDQKKGFIAEMKKVAKKLNLAQSLGSDFHGEFLSPDIEIVKGKNGNLQGINQKNISILKNIGVI